MDPQVQAQAQQQGQYPVQQQSGNTNLWCGELKPYMTDIFISQAFNQAGFYPHTVKMINNRNTGMPAGYCFVEFYSNQEADAARQALNGQIVNPSDPSNHWRLGWAQRKDNEGPRSNMGGGGMEGVGGHGDRHDEYSIFVGELTDEVTDGTLLAYFRMSYPNCKTAKVVTGNDGRSKGYGFVRFYDKAEQLDAITRMHGAVGCGGKILRVREATPKNPRRDGGGGMGGHSQWGGGNQWGGQQQQWGGQQWGQQDPYNQWNQQQAYGWGDYQQGQAGQVQDQTGMQAGSGVAVITPAELTPAMEETLDFTGKYNVKEANEIYLKKETKLLMSNLDAWELPVGQRQAAM